LVAKRLSSFIKKRFNPLIEDRDGVNCFYCDKSFPTKKLGILSFSIDKNMIREFDHLNNDRSDNRLENLVHCHRICNRQKMKNNDWIYKAKAKLRDNERSTDIPIAHAGGEKEIGFETESNSIFCEVALKTLGEKFQPDGKKDYLLKLDLKEFVDLVTAKAYKIVGHCSQNTMIRIVNMFLTPEFQYIKEKDELRRWIIRLRKEEEY